MELLYISGYKFTVIEGTTYSTPAYGIAFWEKYLEVFDTIRILGEEVSSNIDQKSLVKLNDRRITVRILPPNTRPQDLINDRKVKKDLKEEISKSQAILVKQASRKGNMAIAIAEKFGKPYMIELTADLNEELRISNNIIKRVYRPWIYHSVLRAIRNCDFGLYVTQEYLQKAYPIKGKQFGCTDTVLLKCDDDVLRKRLEKIQRFDLDGRVIIGMIATYSGNRKGLDTAIEMLSLFNKHNIELHILGRGTEQDRIYWKQFALKHGVDKQLFFDTPVSGSDKVFEWIDETDINILPSRAEGLPRCIIEAMSRGCPCVTSNVCGLPELIRNEMTHKAGDSIKLKEIIEVLISDRQLMAKEAVDNYSKSKNYLYDVISSKRKDFLNEFRDFCERISR